MRGKFVTTVVGLVLMAGCSKAPEPKQEDPKPEATQKKEEAPSTAMVLIGQYHELLARDCGESLSSVKTKDLDKLVIPDADREKADKLLQEIGEMARQCASLNGHEVWDMVSPDAATCGGDCSWCPVKWYWCIENAGACAGGDNESCCKLGACGSKHHCEDVCKSSCGCDVPPLPSDGGGSGED